MRGLFYYKHRRKRFLALALWGVLFYAVASQAQEWMRNVAEEKLTAFMGGRFSVSIEAVRGGVFHDLVMENVTFISQGEEKGRVFKIARAEISYRLWQVIVDKIIGLSEESAEPRSVSLNFSKDNPFVQGFVEFDSYPGRIDVLGSLSPVGMGERNRIKVKGTFLKRHDGTYHCDVQWDGKTTLSGTMDPVKRAIDLDVKIAEAEGGHLKVNGLIMEDNRIKVYCRADKLKIRGREIIADAWLVYKHGDESDISARVENIIVDKKPYWDLSLEGSFLRKDKVLVVKGLKLGENAVVSGKVMTTRPYVSELKVDVNGLNLAAVSEMIGQTSFPLKGLFSAQIFIDGPIAEPGIKGRIAMGESVVGDLAFKSASATIAGKYPVIKVVDSRIVKEGGALSLTGEADFSRPGGNKFEGMKFEIDDKLALVEKWEITSPGGDGSLQASKDKMTVNASPSEYASSGAVPGAGNKKDEGKVGVNYNLDQENSLKMEFKEDRDLVGVEHKVHF